MGGKAWLSASLVAGCGLWKHAPARLLTRATSGVLRRLRCAGMVEPGSRRLAGGLHLSAYKCRLIPSRKPSPWFGFNFRPSSASANALTAMVLNACLTPDIASGKEKKTSKKNSASKGLGMMSQVHTCSSVDVRAGNWMSLRESFADLRRFQSRLGRPRPHPYSGRCPRLIPDVGEGKPATI
ncbi:hypothetical protein GQ53DRAFT_379313 [Thozetella sp. PMI_491]|nr:hypothetical protein GQ53DRAFT_379313 [Thozetella sp. PMI_491]